MGHTPTPPTLGALRMLAIPVAMQDHEQKINIHTLHLASRVYGACSGSPELSRAPTLLNSRAMIENKLLCRVLILPAIECTNCSDVLNYFATIASTVILHTLQLNSAVCNTTIVVV